MNKLGDVIGKFLLVSSVAFSVPMSALASEERQDKEHTEDHECMHHGKEGYEAKKGGGYFKSLNLSDEQRETVRAMMKE
ncbi:MAG: hypothetical protein R3194_07285, partial [Limnobacter sp.]|nr:hypothetical protein [Limnobacter sp.]